MIGYCSATCRANLGHDAIGSRRTGPFAMRRTTQVVDHHSRAMFRKQQRMSPTQPTPCAGHNHDFIVKTH